MSNSIGNEFLKKLEYYLNTHYSFNRTPIKIVSRKVEFLLEAFMILVNF